MSFSWMGTFREGQWIGFRKFALNERRDVESRINVINAEIRRIGDVILTYEKVEISEPSVDDSVQTSEKVTEERKSVFVTKGSSLEKLVQAYAAQGGSILDVSMFLKPNTFSFRDGTGETQDTEETSENLKGLDRNYPHDGIVAPETPNNFNPVGGVYTGGFLTLEKTLERNLQGFEESDLNATLSIHIDHAKRWMNQSFQFKRRRIEAQIIKLVDLREQLVQERDDVLVQAVGGSIMSSFTVPEPDRYHPDMHLTAIVSSIDKIIWEQTGRGGVNPTVKSENRFSFPTILPDKPGDAHTEL